MGCTLGVPECWEERWEPVKMPPLLSARPIPAGERFLAGSGDGHISFHRLAPCV